jgi:hypothetical protein
VNPSADLGFVAVRYTASNTAPTLPVGGMFAYAGTEQTVTIDRLAPGQPLAVSVFAVDAVGNVAPAAKIKVPSSNAPLLT